MTRTTKAQRRALLSVADRNLATWRERDGITHISRLNAYRAVREATQPTFGCDGAVTVPFAGMWLCIETDGYTHS